MTTFPIGGRSSLFQDIPGAAALPVPPGAIPAAPGQLLGGSGIVGLSQAITVGANLTLDPATHVLSDISGTANVKDAAYGARGDGSHDDTAAIQAALNSTHGRIYLPPGTYVISSALTLTRDNVVLGGAGIQATVIQQNNPAADILDITGGSAQVSGMSLAYGGALGLAGAGTVALNTASLNARFDNLNIFNVATGVKAHGGASGAVQFFDRLQVQYATSSCFWVDNTTDTRLTRFVLSPGAADGGGAGLAVNGAIRLTGAVEAFTAVSGATFGGLYSLATSGAALARGSCPAFCEFTNVYFDSSADLGLFCNDLIESVFTSCWIASGRNPGNPKSGAQLSSTIGVKFIGCQFIANGSHGLVLNTGSVGTLINGCTFDSNGGQSAPGASAGIAVVAGVTDFIITGNRFGNGVIGAPDGGGTMAFGVSVSAGPSDRYVIRNNLFDSTVPTAISDGGTGTHKDVVAVIGSGGGSYTLPTAAASVLGGVKVGTGLAIDGSGVLSATGGGSYTLPTSSASVLGGVKVGSGLAIDGTGVLSVSYSYTLPAATTSTLGGVIVGTGLGVTSGTVSVTYGGTTPVMDGTGTVGVANTAARSDHVHPTDTSRYAASNPSGYQTAAQVSSSISAAAYSLPTASTTVLGGVKVDGSSVTISGGVISASTSYTLPTASTTVLGGVKVDGTSITISSGVISANTSGGVTLAVAGTDPVPVAPGTAAVGSSGKAAREDHVHPTDTSRLAVTTAASTYLPLAGGTMTSTLTVAPGTLPGISVDNSGAAGTTPALTLTNTTGGAGVNLRLIGNGATAPGKFIRVTAGLFQIINDAYSANLLSMDDSGVITLASALPVASGGTGATTAAAARTSLGVSATAFGVSFDQGAVVANGTITVVRKAPFAMTINSLDYEVGSAGGSFTVAVQIAGTNVTGLSAVAVSSSTSANAAATAANTVSAGQAITIVITSTTGSPTGANLQINATR